MNKSEELPNEGLSVSFLVRMEDMTARINAALDTVNEEERKGVIRKLSAEIVSEATADTHYKARVKSFLAEMTFT